MADTDILIHSAAYFSEYQKSGDSGPLQEINVKGTISLLEAAYQQGTRNCVYISSAGVLENREGQATDETCPYPACPDNLYFKSKIDAEKEIFDFMDSHPQMRVVFILPTVMLGPGDRGPTPIGGFILKLIKGDIKIVLPGSLQFVDVRDVAKAVVTAIHKGASGRRYIVGGERIEQKVFYRALGKATGKPMPTRQPPYLVILAFAWLMKLAGKISNKRPPVNPANVKRMNRDFWFSSDRAQQELDVSFRPISETLADTVSWFQIQHMAWERRSGNDI